MPDMLTEVVVDDVAAAKLREENQVAAEAEWAKKARVDKVIRELNTKMSKYFQLVGRLGARAARRKAGLSAGDVGLWNHLQMRNRVLADARAKVLGAQPGDPGTREAAPEGAASTATDGQALP